MEALFNTDLFWDLFPWIVGLIFVLGFWIARRVQQANPDLFTALEQYTWLYETAVGVVMRVAFNVTPEERSQYEREAVQTGRDVRLVTAYRELMQIAASKGITIPLVEAISIIERVYQEIRPGKEPTEEFGEGHTVLPRSVYLPDPRADG